ncbi:MAG: hypothetical protein KC910_30345 [Candidatus Eremiobacteraeota bacterium]|nr:hypothetical protein [Candidatus Eremiobacteraeota bacterium]
MRWLFVTLLLSLAGCAPNANHAQRIKHLEGLFPQLSSLQVTAYRNQDWCRNLAYQRGNFSQSTHPSTCNLFEGKVGPFDPKAQADFESIASALGGDRPRVLWLNIDYQEGKIRTAEFALDTSTTRESYLYTHDTPEDLDGEIMHKPLGGHWYLRLEDWN